MLVVFCRIVGSLEVRTFGVGGGKVDLEHALDDDGYLYTVALAGLAKGDRKQREAPLLIVPVGARAECHRARAIVEHLERGRLRGGYVLDEGAVIGEREDLGGGGHMRGAAVEAAGIGDAAIGHDVQVALHRRGIVARNHEHGEVSFGLLARSNVVSVIGATRAVRAIGARVLVCAGIIDAGDVGVGVAAGNAGTRLALDGRRGVNGGAVAKQVAVGGVAVGGTHRQRAHGPRGHVRTRCRGSSIACAVKRFVLVGRGSRAVVVAEGNISFLVNSSRIRIGRVNHRRQVARGLATTGLYFHARCGKAVLTIPRVNLAQEYALGFARIVAIAVHEHV